AQEPSAISVDLPEASLPVRYTSIIYTLNALFLGTTAVFDATATPELNTLSLHDALPICDAQRRCRRDVVRDQRRSAERLWFPDRSEEHTSELQSRENLVCRLLLEKKHKGQSRYR